MYCIRAWKRDEASQQKEYNSIVTEATFLTSATIILLIAGTAIFAPLATPLHPASAQSFMDTGSNLVVEPKAPMAVSPDGNNVYIVWWTNKSENWEVMFRASTDGGQTFGDKINLSDSSDTESQNAEMVAAGDSVFVSWWETSPETGSSESVLRVSTDRGQTFGPPVMLGTNGTISTTETAETTATSETTTTSTTATGVGGEQEEATIGSSEGQLLPEEQQAAEEEAAATTAEAT
jgi:hypothetical protein